MSLVKLNALSKHYGSVKALNALNLELDAGEPIALIGPNGAGKTTLLSLLCGYIKPTSGEATVLGHKPGSRALSGRLAALPQDAYLDPRFTVQKHLSLFARLQGLSRKDSEREVQRVLETVQLSDSSRQKPGELSHGMRKRISLAQALLGKPELILLDEPTAGIDPPNVKIIRDLVRAESANATFFISSHNLDELEKLCKSVVYLSEGKLVEASEIDNSADAGFLTVRLLDVPEEQFLNECRKLTGVLEVSRQAQGDYLIRQTEGHAVDQALLLLLAKHGWRYRHLIKGRSLEERLYG